MIPRKLKKLLNEKLWKGKALIVLGARQTGKTTLVKAILDMHTSESLYLNCDEPRVRELLTGASTVELRGAIGNRKYVCIDEAQRIMDIGITLKLITDGMPGVQLIVTGSSSLELAGGINEPLTGRKLEYLLPPISVAELLDHHGELAMRDDLERRIVFGMYPDVINHPGEEEELLHNLAGSVLYKDILSLRDIRRPAAMEKLLQALAFQTGSQVSYHELSGLVGVDRATVETYIGLLEQAFVVFRLQPLARNLRNEISTSRKIYFWDTGIRNAVISNFNPPSLRTDTGALWENFIIAERLKYWATTGRSVIPRFWRTYQRQEIDYIEEYGGSIHAYECKWGEKGGRRIPRTFLHAYPGAGIYFITPSNAFAFATGADVSQDGEQRAEDI